MQIFLNCTGYQRIGSRRANVRSNLHLSTAITFTKRRESDGTAQYLSTLHIRKVLCLKVLLRHKFSQRLLQRVEQIREWTSSSLAQKAWLHASRWSRPGSATDPTSAACYPKPTDNRPKSCQCSFVRQPESPNRPQLSIHLGCYPCALWNKSCIKSQMITFRRFL